MNGRTILKSTGCDPRSLPLDVREAFFLAQVDGVVTLDELAAVVGMDLDGALTMAAKLLGLSAVAVRESVPPSLAGAERRSKHGSGALERHARRAVVDPRAELEPTSLRGSERRSPLVSPARGEQRSSVAGTGGTEGLPPRVGRAHATPLRRPTPRPERRRSRGAIGAASNVATGTEDVVCELDDATVAKIIALDARLEKRDHYSLLEIERGADKKTIKRAYFRLSATFHPDRFFGKRLGSARAAVERIFLRFTEAHDTLTAPDRRAAYDATLPREAAPSERRRSNRMKRISRELGAVTKENAPRRRSSKGLRAVEAPPPVASPSVVPPPDASRSVAPPPIAPSVASSSVVASPAKTLGPERMRQLRAAMGEIEAQRKVDLLVTAAEEALRTNDVVTAANNYRLALSYREDPRLREKYEACDGRARVLRFEKNVTAARAAARDARWSDAAVFFARAHEARPDADMAARAGHALRMSGGDLTEAAALAERAVALDAKCIAHRITLAEIYVAANRLGAAEATTSRALVLAPRDTRLKELAAMIAQRMSSNRS
ncbi:MAG: hypothetical protein BGO98_16885 [Myxococcales bacterium 68-20]|nr:MAG: hypothetical protein BGO98_16885 [Myxococcales bacterium 68-20]